ncbi:uncharacterized protein LA080_000204 [Diaporthe eres]|nr:uncharacterized protein LA080_000204 [Diaporthe eres]
MEYTPLSFLCLGATLGVLLTFASRSSYESTWLGPGRPYLIPCKTTHRRLVPKPHSFAYSYLTVGIPVGFKGSVNGMIGVEENAGIDPTDYPHAYLITAARFAGYNFNPVSLWYPYSPDKILNAIVLEVNNTFDERRPYILVRDVTDEPRHTAHEQRLRIKGSRVRDFHVSPFNSRDGYYSVLTSDPLGPGMDGYGGIDVTITLNSSQGRPKLIACLKSDGPAVDPAFLDPLSKLTFVARWFWVGFATLPRIFWQAAVLLYRRKLDMWNKPEPLVGTLGRRATSVEESLELCFSKYIESLVWRSERPLAVKYYTSGLLSSTERIFTSLNCNDSESGDDSENHDILELRVLTPAFYSRFFDYGNNLDGVHTELRIHRTIWVDKPELLPCVFGEMSITTRAHVSKEYKQIRG